MRRLGICAPVFNEEEGIEEFLSRVDLSAEKMKTQVHSIQIILFIVNDGSHDKTLKKISEFQPNGFDEIHLHTLSRNFGHTSAVSALFEISRPMDAIILMDADLQDSPEIIPQLVSYWTQGFDSVRVVRGRRKEGFLFSILSKLFYKTFQKLSHLDSGIGNFGLYSQRVAEAVRAFPERARYLPGIISLAGFKTHFIPLDREARQYGESRVGFQGLFKLAVLALFSFSTLPIQLMAAGGLILSFLSTLAGFSVILVRLFYGTSVAIPGWASYLTAQFFLGGLIIFCLGIIGQYVAIIFEEVKARPQFFFQDSQIRTFEHRSLSPPKGGNVFETESSGANCKTG